ncbi:outer membrane lipoprotein carrier protein LolA [Acidipila sp. 4G-K13]|uniref:Outer membrane lipoprotein carrier protein LolA n=2 Tax=Paracidobacterium acidisoli TaxID=2303751 RepID=A0A372ILF5_9BACT|nr:outer membrane lipoprotein carrier protein LolA [Paracidobacterium acidisoli]
MRAQRKALFAAILLLTSAFPAWSQQPAAAALASRVDHHYNSLHSLEAHFTQTYEGMGMHRRESGVLLLKKAGALRLSGKMRWTYSEPAGKLFVLDGHDGYFYAPGSAEAQRIPAKDLDDLHSPLRFLLGHTELEKELGHLLMTSGEDGTYVLSGVPKGMEQRVSSLSLTVTADGTIQAMKIEETDGVLNTFTFADEHPNVPVTDSQFLFTPPPGVHVVTGMQPM